MTEDRRYRKKNKSKDRDYEFNSSTRKKARNQLFLEMSRLLEKYNSLSEHDLIFCLNLIRHKILEGYEKAK